MKKTYLQIIPLVWSIYNLYNRKNTSINTEWTIYFSWSDWFLTTKACCQLLPKPWVRPRRAAGGSTATLHPTGRWAQGDLNGCWGIADINGYHGMARQLLGKREYPRAILVIFCPWFFESKFHFKVGRFVELVGENGAFQRPYVRRFICGNGRTCNSTSNMDVAIASGDQSGDSAYISSSNSMWPAQKFTMSS